MPRIASFYGIVITMYFEEHGVPHFHAHYAEHDASISIDMLEVLGGSLPDRVLNLVRRWAKLHRDELSANWERARNEDPLESIDPLP
jgi:hypothetical protein